MSKNLQSFVKGAGMLRSVVNRVPSDAWDSASCCEGWSAREVAGHIAWGLDTTASFAHGSGPAPEIPEADKAGEDPAATVSASIAGALASLDRLGALVRPTPWGMEVDGFCALMGVDTLTHAWDIADAVGIDHGIDEASAISAHETISPIAERMRGPGRFGDEVRTESPHAIDRFIAFTGRTSVRST